MAVTPGPQETNGAAKGPVPFDWGRLLAEHEPWLRRTIRLRVGEEQAVDEVWQEVARAAAAQAGPLRDPERAPAWLHRLAVRQSLLLRRRAGRQRKLVGRFGQRQPAASPTPDGLAWLLRTERHELVRTALAQAPTREAEVLLLKYAEGLSGVAIAARLGLSVSAVEARLHRARARLREILGRLGLNEAES